MTLRKTAISLSLFTILNLSGMTATGAGAEALRRDRSAALRHRIEGLPRAADRQVLLEDLERATRPSETSSGSWGRVLGRGGLGGAVGAAIGAGLPVLVGLTLSGGRGVPAGAQFVAVLAGAVGGLVGGTAGAGGELAAWSRREIGARVDGADDLDLLEWRLQRAERGISAGGAGSRAPGVGKGPSWSQHVLVGAMGAHLVAGIAGGVREIFQVAPGGTGLPVSPRLDRTLTFLRGALRTGRPSLLVGLAGAGIGIAVHAHRRRLLREELPQDVVSPPAPAPARGMPGDEDLVRTE